MGRHKHPENAALPLWVQVVKGSYYIKVPRTADVPLGWPRNYPLGKVRGDALVEAKRIFKELGLSPFVYRTGKQSTAIPREVVRALWHRCRRNGKQRGIECDITFEQMESIAGRSQGRCEVSGLAFQYEKAPGHYTRPWAPSIDRVECAKGYTKSNCRVVCFAVNVAMNQWGVDTLFRVASALVARRKTLPVAPRIF